MGLQDIVADSLVIELDVSTEGFHVREIPITRTDVGITLASKEHTQLVMDTYHQLSENIKKPHFVYENYKRFADTYVNRYLREFLGRTWIIKVINGLTRRKLLRLLLGKTSYLGIQNFIECEAHHELFLQGLKNINRK